jgi:hypothetical protein
MVLLRTRNVERATFFSCCGTSALLLGALSTDLPARRMLPGSEYKRSPRGVMR